MGQSGDKETVRRLWSGPRWEVTVGMVNGWILKCFRRKTKNWSDGWTVRPSQIEAGNVSRVCGRTLDEAAGILWCDKGEQDRRDSVEVRACCNEASATSYDALVKLLCLREWTLGRQHGPNPFFWVSTYLSMQRSWLSSFSYVQNRANHVGSWWALSTYRVHSITFRPLQCVASKAFRSPFPQLLLFQY